MFKLGQKVRIKDYKHIERKHLGEIYFDDEGMSEYCGKVFEILDIEEMEMYDNRGEYENIYHLDIGKEGDWWWAGEWLTDATNHVKLEDDLFKI